MSGRLLTTRQVAELVSLSPETILRRFRAGELRGVRLGSNVLRFRPADVDAWLAGNSSPLEQSAPSNQPSGVA